MSTHQTAKTRYIDGSNGSKFAYRRLGTGSGTPLLFLIHFRGVMDRWDPLLINSIAEHRPVILVDYVGVGLSVGEVATTIRQSAAQMIEFLQLIGEPEVDVLGFSIGGLVAQVLALNADPAILKVRKLILTGTSPSYGPGVETTTNDIVAWAGSPSLGLENFQVLFFPKTAGGTKASEAWWDRIHERGPATSGEEAADYLSQGHADGGKGVTAQMGQAIGFTNAEATEGLGGSIGRLHELNMPVLVAQGHDDWMLPTVNSFLIQQKVPNGTLLIYPDSGHGFLFQFARQFSKFVVDWLSE
ncbi:alpha/beta-hydrolase [Periconia macrospinosa]|uniref:Alpha/beta-hydrolase n=1 Tax=Periconia macrospinosa TaxID=97972 RepID=A0A2V1CZE5_9PLEO|nr:alpha/beta-hydrolase [Periconia macrospinosa]